MAHALCTPKIVKVDDNILVCKKLKHFKLIIKAKDKINVL